LEWKRLAYYMSIWKILQPLGIVFYDSLVIKC
jgi:hypothetical protein